MPNEMTCRELVERVTDYIENALSASKRISPPATAVTATSRKCAKPLKPSAP